MALQSLGFALIERLRKWAIHEEIKLDHKVRALQVMRYPHSLIPDTHTSKKRNKELSLG